MTVGGKQGMCCKRGANHGSDNTMKLGMVSALWFMSLSPAHAYVGPGAGLGAIAAILAVGVGLLLLIVGFIYFPIRRMLRARKAAKADATPDTDQA